MPSEENKIVARRVCEEAWNQGKLEVLEECYSDPFIFHYHGAHSWTLDQYKQLISRWRTAFADFRFDVEDVIAEGDKVVLRIPFSGKHVGVFRGAAPTGKTIYATEMIIARFVEGKIVEEWEDWDEIGLLQQIGAIPVK